MTIQNTLFTSITSYIQQLNLIQDRSTLIVGLSGGPDSMFLLHFLHAYALKHASKIVAVHINHKWRNEADAEEALCKAACDQLAIVFESANLPDIMGNTPLGGSKEAYARTGRRLFFEQMKTKHNAHAIALAHHAQDQQETFFLRLLRGSSLTGLTGMKPQHGNYIRPLLQTNKKDIVEYLNAHAIEYAQDASNDSNDYLRNRIRNNVIPALNQADSRFENNFARTLLQLQEAEQELEQLTLATYQKAIIIRNNKSMLDVAYYLQLTSYLQNRVLLHWLISYRVSFTPTQSLYQEINRFLHNTQSNSHAIHTHWKIIKQKQYATIEIIVHSM